MSQVPSHALEKALPVVLPAHVVLPCPLSLAGEPEAGRHVDRIWLHVQGRSDRLHVLGWGGGLGHDELRALTATMLELPANWRWLAVPAAEVESARAIADGLGLGVLSFDGATLTRVTAAAPLPGIFMPSHPVLRRRWKALSSW